MEGSAARLTPWTEGSTINGKQIVHRSPGVRKTGRVILAFLCAFCILPPPNGESASGRKQASRGAKGSLGTVEFRVSCTPAAQKYFTRGVALFIPSLTRNPRKHSGGPRRKIPNAPWRTGAWR